MARGSLAKSTVTNKIMAAFGDDFIGENGGKLYVWASDGGERVQIAIAMTCPKNPVTEVTMPSGAVTSGGAWGDPVETPTNAPSAEITKEETETLEQLMKKLGL